MTAQIAAYGRLIDDPQTKQTSKGTPMTLARMAVSLPRSQAHRVISHQREAMTLTVTIFRSEG